MPRNQHQRLLSKFAQWVRPEGYVFATLANSSHPGYTEPDFFSTTMFWSHYDSNWYSAQLEGLGFDVLHVGVLGSGYRDVGDLPSERHALVLARRRRTA